MIKLYCCKYLADLEWLPVGMNGVYPIKNLKQQHIEKNGAFVSRVHIFELSHLTNSACTINTKL